MRVLIIQAPKSGSIYATNFLKAWGVGKRDISTTWDYTVGADKRGADCRASEVF